MPSLLGDVSNVLLGIFLFSEMPPRPSRAVLFRLLVRSVSRLLTTLASNC